MRDSSKIVLDANDTGTFLEYYQKQLRVLTSWLPYQSVPIYDARKANFDISASSFSNIKAILPKFNGEVPDDSMIVAAYTLGTYLDKDSIHNISPNIIWVAVLGEATE